MNVSDPIDVPAGMNESSKQSAEIKDWLEKVEFWHRRLEPRFPDIDPHDLRMILRSMFQPPCVKRRWLLQKTKDGRYVL